MKRVLKFAGLALLGVAGIAAIVSGIGRYLWSRESSESLRMMALATPARNATFDPSELAHLPPPVQRYFRFALAPGQHLIRSARVVQSGAFATAPGKWSAFSGVETFNVHPPEFLWDAAISMAPLLVTMVRDSYIRHEGSLTAKVGGLITVARDGGNPKVNSGELLRYLAELPYLPTALLPSEGVRWTPLDAVTAKATLTDGDLSVSLDFRFAETGAITEISGERYRTSGGAITLEKWRGHWAHYRRVSGMMVPGDGMVEWLMPAGAQPYWRGTTEGIEYTFSDVGN